MDAGLAVENSFRSWAKVTGRLPRSWAPSPATFMGPYYGNQLSDITVLGIIKDVYTQRPVDEE